MTEVRFPENGLSAEYGDIIIGDVVSTVQLEVSFSGNVIASEAYSPDENGEIAIKDIGELAMVYFEDGSFSSENGIDASVIELDITITEGENSISKTVTIYPSIVDFSGSLDVETLLIMPLSRQTKKNTCIGRKEYICFYGGQTINAYVMYKSTTGDKAKTVELSTLDTSGKIYRLDVSISVIATLADVPEGDIVHYSVYASRNAIVRYFVDDKNYPTSRTFIFRNCFGAQESFTCIGDEVSARSWTRNYGNILNKKSQVSRELENKLTVNSGPIDEQEMETLEDLLNSEHVCLLDEQGFQEIVILSESFETNTRLDELKSMEFSYRFAQKNQFKTTYEAFKKPRIFAFEFDETFE